MINSTCYRWSMLRLPDHFLLLLFLLLLWLANKILVINEFLLPLAGATDRQTELLQLFLHAFITHRLCPSACMTRYLHFLFYTLANRHLFYTLSNFNVKQLIFSFTDRHDQ